MNQFLIKREGDRLTDDEVYKCSINLNSIDLNLFKLKRINHKNSICVDFVGILSINGTYIISFPKSYGTSTLKNISDVNRGDIIILLKTLLKFQSIENKVSGTNGLGDNNTESKTSYPFNDFISIYNYYMSYGLYQNSKTIVKRSFRGNKIDWKKTILKSQTIISKGNIIYYPFYEKIKEKEFVFLSDCMAFAINYTLDNYNFLFPHHSKIEYEINFDFLNKTTFVISKLNLLLKKTFKDRDRLLIKSLISFFKKIANRKFYFIQYNFHNVWELMVKKYLNRYFCGVDKNNKPIFSKIGDNNIKFFKPTLKIDGSYNNFCIEPDYYFLDSNKNCQYIFDAKYYLETNYLSLNYKQLVYGFILDNEAETTYNCLIFPGNEEKYQEHFSLIQGNLKKNIKSKIKIGQLYLDPKNVMLSFIKD